MLWEEGRGARPTGCLVWWVKQWTESLDNFSLVLALLLMWRVWPWQSIQLLQSSSSSSQNEQVRAQISKSLPSSYLPRLSNLGCLQHSGAFIIKMSQFLTRLPGKSIYVTGKFQIFLKMILNQFWSGQSYDTTRNLGKKPKSCLGQNMLLITRPSPQYWKWTWLGPETGARPRAALQCHGKSARKPLQRLLLILHE